MYLLGSGPNVYNRNKQISKSGFNKKVFSIIKEVRGKSCWANVAVPSLKDPGSRLLLPTCSSFSIWLLPQEGCLVSSHHVHHLVCKTKRRWQSGKVNSLLGKFPGSCYTALCFHLTDQHLAPWPQLTARGKDKLVFGHMYLAKNERVHQQDRRGEWSKL